MKIAPTTTITIDNVPIDVAQASESVKQLVAYLDDWRQKEVDLTSDLLMTRAALQDIQRTLVTVIQQESSAVTPTEG